MKVFIDKHPLPGGMTADLYVGDSPRVVIQSEFSNEALKFLRGFLDGKPHTVTFADDTGEPQMVANAKFDLRVLSTTARNAAGSLELSGAAWGTPPNYNEFFVESETEG